MRTTAYSESLKYSENKKKRKVNETQPIFNDFLPHNKGQLTFFVTCYVCFFFYLTWLDVICVGAVLYLNCAILCFSFFLEISLPLICFILIDLNSFSVCNRICTPQNIKQPLTIWLQFHRFYFSYLDFKWIPFWSFWVEKFTFGVNSKMVVVVVNIAEGLLYPTYQWVVKDRMFFPLNWYFPKKNVCFRDLNKHKQLHTLQYVSLIDMDFRICC